MSHVCHMCRAALAVDNVLDKAEDTQRSEDRAHHPDGLRNAAFS